MKISPLDIQQQQFKGKMLGGIDPEDVDVFLQQVAQEMEELIRENTELKEQVRRTATEAEEMRQREVNLRETMLAAQKVIEEMKGNAEREARLIVSEAELKAERVVADAEASLVQLNNQIQEMRRDKVKFESALKSLLDSHYRMLTLTEEQ
ncbi:DivIVA domain-containing protein [Geobacter sp. DSM 9736]|uniref:DivIVA domain-containing protein n=1 Tax=Geobacter sp. DSM 9736 TaxID=1277350 RepID=UPI000B5059EB|nr:DivIVA domain-containing protein [Geobacter sp. DSM 9736]SNB45917.1 cell division initiation protein [Geobacter sp. DSM 9736]